MNFKTMMSLSLLALFTMQCAQGGSTSAGANAANSGNYRDKSGVQYAVDSSIWKVTYPGTGSCDRSVLVAAEGQVTYSEQGSGCFNPGKFGRLYFIKDGASDMWFCDFISGKSSVDDVKAITGSPDSSAASTGGCNGKAWVKLSATDSNFSLVGSFTDNWSSSHSFSNTLWTTGGCTNAIIYYDNTNGFFLYQQQADAGCWAANNYKFGKVFWAVDSASKLYYCQLMYDKSSYLDVANSTAKPTYTNPSATGCGGFSWTQLIR